LLLDVQVSKTVPAVQALHCNVVVQLTCPASDDQLADAITNLNRDEYDRQMAAIDAQ
jgi:hypothetical protein